MEILVVFVIVFVKLRIILKLDFFVGNVYLNVNFYVFEIV